VLDTDMQRVVQEQRLGYVASVCSDGTPNLSPKGTLAVWDDDHLVFAHLIRRHRRQHRGRKRRVEVNVVDPILRKGYRFKGPATASPGRRMYDKRSQLLLRTEWPRSGLWKRSCLVRVEHAAYFLATPTTGRARPKSSSDH
jgi:predicted pyridoxine 5'-phosphate oxidase superfamily flavin-nucleotide-binding protein